MTAPSKTVPPPEPGSVSSQSPRFFPRIGSPTYHLLLASVAILILGPLGGISAAYMNFSIGFFIAGQVLAGILGSTVTLPYGPEGKHGANYMQTMAASVAGMSAMAPLIQAMVWLGLPVPPAWVLILYFLCIGMFGVGLGMLYTPIVVDRMRLTYPSGLAVTNILRALTDKDLLKRSIAKLGGSMAAGYIIGVASVKVAVLVRAGLSASTFGGGMIVGARIALPALVMALIGRWQTPHLVSMGWLKPGDPYRKIGFIISLGTILGAVMLDLAILLVQAVRRLREKSGDPPPPTEDWKRVNTLRLAFWVLFWAVATVCVGNGLLHAPVFFLLVAVGLCFLFVLVNGIALGISDFNPISSAFVMSVFTMAAIGLRDPGVGLLCAGVLAIATSEGGDMQQDRSTGWRLGTNRIVQFRYQVIGIAAGAVLAVALAKLFMSAYPILTQDQFANPHLEGAQKWQSAFTFKMVGALRGITHFQPQVMEALALGTGAGLFIEIVRKRIKSHRGYEDFSTSSRYGRAAAFCLDAIFLPSPYAAAFGGFVELATILYWAAGGVTAPLLSAIETKLSRPRRSPGVPPASRAGTSTRIEPDAAALPIGSSSQSPRGRKTESPPPEAASKEGDLPADMSTTSLLGGGLIAGDSMAALTIGIIGLLKTVW